MMKDDIIETIRETFYLRSEEIGEATSLREFVRDSIDAVELVAVLSSRYSIRVDPVELDGIQTVGGIVEYVQRAGARTTAVPLESF